MTKIRLLLRDLRQAHELSQEELARQLNISRQSIISLERGEYLPSAPLLIAMMEFFNCPIETLIDGVRIRVQEINEFEKGGEEQMQLTQWNPFQAMDRFHEEIDDIFERNFSRSDWSRTLSTSAGAMNIEESDTEYEISIQAPGYAENDIVLEATSDSIVVTGSKKQGEEKKDKRLVRKEWEYSEFSRSIRFSTPIKDEAVEAKLENGTLHIVAPKTEPAKPKTTKIEVKKK
jgi:HSP20 family molecular chaperone IbpA